MTTQTAPAIENLTTATPAEIDTEIYRLHVNLQRLGQRLVVLRRTLGQAENKAAGYGVTYRGPSVAELTEQISVFEQEMSTIPAQLAPLGAEFIRRGGWTRWYLVLDGHLHYDVAAWRCSRVPTTEHYWMTEHSGRTEAEMIELAGDRVCTTCFPNAPVAPRPATARFMTPTEAERAAYREAQTRKRAAAKAARITAPDGSELRAANDVFGDLIKTETAARRRALADAADLAFYGESHPSAGEWRETVARMIAALAHHTGTDVTTLRDEINAKVAKKAKREGWEVSAHI